MELVAVGRTYSTGAAQVHALRGISLRIEAGEMVAIVGASGSGKSTLMNLLGCLDQPSEGDMFIEGVPVSSLGLSELARLRRERFGFIFQRYHLIREQNALANVSMPAIYAGMPVAQRRDRAARLLSRLGLAERLAHRPHALSGGQQQRVSIARALMNGGEIILADEPTGALDSRTGKDMMALLLELHQQGHTVIIVTHDVKVAAHAGRVVQLQDGQLLSDSGWPADRRRASFEPPPRASHGMAARALRPLGQLRDAMHMAWGALTRHRLRTVLGTLGIGVGIAAVVGVMALGQALRTNMEATLRGFLSNKLMVSSGNPQLGPGVLTKDFSEGDVQALSQLAQVQSVRPSYETSVTARQGRHSDQLSVQGMAPADLALEGYTLHQGRGLSDLDRRAMQQVVVLSPLAASKLFPGLSKPVGQTLMLGEVPFEVVGLTGEASGGNAMANWQATAFVPDSTMVAKMLGSKDTRQLFVYMKPGADPEVVQQSVTQTLKQRHGAEDFSIFNQEQQFRQAGQASDTMRLVLTAIASISLLVGGVGVMNMMLVAVAERTAEIGIRMAVGARPGDVQAQFLVEAVVLCGMGGLLGMTLSGLLIWGMNVIKPDLDAALSAWAVGLAFAVSSAMGLIFGFFPARQASRLSPVLALARE
jgi:macrolide transport system ATP-binding/permease protein